MLSHVHIGVTDFQRAFAFYRALMETLGYPIKIFEPEKFWTVKPINAERPLFLMWRAHTMVNRIGRVADR